MKRQFLAFARDTILFCIAIAIFQSLPEGTAPSVERAFYSRNNQEEVETNWPLRAHATSTIHLEAEMDTSGVALPTYIFSVTGCLEEFYVNTVLVEGVSFCNKRNTAVDLGEYIDGTVHEISAIITHKEGDAVLNIAPAQKNKSLVFSNVRYSLNSGRKYKEADWPLRVPFTSPITVRFDMHLPVVHADTYVMKFSGCLNSLTINDLPYRELKEGVCSTVKLYVADYVKAGTNTVRAVIESRGGVDELSIHADEKDKVFFFFKALIILAIVLYGFFRMP